MEGAIEKSRPAYMMFQSVQGQRPYSKIVDELPKGPANRVVGQEYTYQGEIRIWVGWRLRQRRTLRNGKEITKKRNLTEGVQFAK